MTLMGDTPFETPHYENPIASDLSHKINRSLDFGEQEQIYLVNKQEQQIENTKKNNSTFGRINLKDEIPM